MKFSDVIYFILRAFNNDNVSIYDETIDIIKDINEITQELMLYDLNTCENAIKEMENIFKLKQEGRELRFEYDALFKIWFILAGFNRPQYIAPEYKIIDIEKIIFDDISLPGKCKGKPIKFAHELFDDQDIKLLNKYNFYTAKEFVYIVNMSPRQYLRNECEQLNILKKLIFILYFIIYFIIFIIYINLIIVI